MKRRRKDSMIGNILGATALVLGLTMLGWFIWIMWQSASQEDQTNLKILETTESSSQQTETKTTPKYDLSISEWGVGANYDTSKETLEYKISGNRASFVAKSLNGKDYCTYGSSGSITRYAPDDNVGYPDGGSLGKAKDNVNEARLKKVGNYYYQTSGPQATCSSDATDKEIMAASLRQHVFDNLTEEN